MRLRARNDVSNHAILQRENELRFRVQLELLAVGGASCKGDDAESSELDRLPGIGPGRAISADVRCTKPRSIAGVYDSCCIQHL